MNLAQTLLDAAENDPEHVAVKLDDTELSYQMLAGATAHLAGLLAEHGAVAGDRVGIMLPNVPYFPVVYYGVLRAGGIVVPMNVLLKKREVAFYLEDSGAKLLFAWEGFAEDAQAGAEQAGAECILVESGRFEEIVGAAEPITEVADTADDDTAVILYTGHHRHAQGGRADPRQPDPQRRGLARAVRPRLRRRGARRAAAVPLLRADLRDERDPRRRRHAHPDPALRSRQGAGDHRARPGQRLPGRADHVRGDAPPPGHEDADTSSLTVCASGGSAMPVELMRGFEEAFGCKVLEGYGLSETSPVASFNHPDRERKPGSIGTPIEGVEMKVVDDDGNDVAQGEVGEIVIRGHNVMKGYWDRDDATAETIRDGWLYTGDMGRIDEDGYFFIVDRKKDMIIRGGYNVYPREIEEVLYEHPAVREAAVVGVPHDEYGEEIGAAVALKDGEARRSCASSSRSRSPPTSTRAACGSSTSCPRARPARSSSGKSPPRS